MSDAKHTPGPWKVHAGRDVYGPAGQYLADIRYGRPPCCPDGECAANARLIAAAPNLLAALVELTEAAGEAWPDRPCVRIAREAIAKAEGR